MTNKETLNLEIRDTYISCTNVCGGNLRSVSLSVHGTHGAYRCTPIGATDEQIVYMFIVYKKYAEQMWAIDIYR